MTRKLLNLGVQRQGAIGTPKIRVTIFNDRLRGQMYPVETTPAHTDVPHRLNPGGAHSSLSAAHAQSRTVCLKLYKTTSTAGYSRPSSASQDGNRPAPTTAQATQLQKSTNAGNSGSRAPPTSRQPPEYRRRQQIIQQKNTSTRREIITVNLNRRFYSTPTHTPSRYVSRGTTAFTNRRQCSLPVAYASAEASTKPRASTPATTSN